MPGNRAKARRYRTLAPIANKCIRPLDIRREHLLHLFDMRCESPTHWITWLPAIALFIFGMIASATERVLPNQFHFFKGFGFAQLKSIAMGNPLPIAKYQQVLFDVIFNAKLYIGIRHNASSGGVSVTFD